jgi:hypothetical protein
MSTTAKRFNIGFAVGAVLAVSLNLMPYLRTLGAYKGDGFEIIGAPFVFRRLGGIAGIYEFSAIALVADIVVALVIALLVAYTCLRVPRGDSSP